MQFKLLRPLSILHLNTLRSLQPQPSRPQPQPQFQQPLQQRPPKPQPAASARPSTGAFAEPLGPRAAHSQGSFGESSVTLQLTFNLSSPDEEAAKALLLVAGQFQQLR